MWSRRADRRRGSGAGQGALEAGPHGSYQGAVFRPRHEVGRFKRIAREIIKTHGRAVDVEYQLPGAAAIGELPAGDGTVRGVKVGFLHHVVANFACPAHQCGQHAETVAALVVCQGSPGEVSKGCVDILGADEGAYAGGLLKRRRAKRLRAPLHDQRNAMPPFMDAALVTPETARGLVPGSLFGGYPRSAIVARK